MELIIIKTGNDYIRVKEDQFISVQFDKASVFPMDHLELVREYEANLRAAGYTNVALKKLVIEEEDLLI